MNSGVSPSRAGWIVARVMCATILAVGVYAGRGLVADAADGVRSWGALIWWCIEAGFVFLCLVVAYHGWLCRSARAVRWICLVTAFVAFFGVVTGVTRMIATMTCVPIDQASGPADPAVWGVLAVIGAIVFYRLMIHWLLPRVGLVDDRSAAQRLWSVKVSLGLIGLLIFGSVPRLGFEMRGRSYRRGGPDIWEMVAVLGPAILAILIYRVGVYLARRRIERRVGRGAG